MSSVALAPTAVSRPAVNPWLVAVAVVVPTFMEILDTSIATSSLRYNTAGGMSASMVDSDGVMASYLAANAIILPITGWLSAHFFFAPSKPLLTSKVERLTIESTAVYFAVRGGPERGAGLLQRVLPGPAPQP